MPDFVDNGWAYLENGTPKYWQTPLVDSEFVHSHCCMIINRRKRIYFKLPGIPFKGIIPVSRCKNNI